MRLLIALPAGALLLSTSAQVAATLERDGLFAGLLHLGAVLAFIEISIRLAKK